jgi:WD40 repeat protein
VNGYLSLTCVGSSQIITGHRDGTIRVFDRNRRTTQVLKLHNSEVISLALIDNGRIGLSLDANANVGLSFIEDIEPIGLIKNDSSASGNHSSMEPQAWVDANSGLSMLFCHHLGRTESRHWNIAAPTRQPPLQCFLN